MTFADIFLRGEEEETQGVLLGMKTELRRKQYFGAEETDQKQPGG